MVRDVRAPSLAHSPSIGVLLERGNLANDSTAEAGPSSRRMSRNKAGSTSTAASRTSTRPPGRRLANLLSSEANGTPVVTKGRRYGQATPTMMRADETMLYDIAPPPDMPSSSLFGDESDDDTQSSPRPTKGNAVKGKGNLLTPVNSTLIAAPPSSRLSTSRSVRLPSPESLPQAGDNADSQASRSRRRTLVSKLSSSQRSRSSNVPADLTDSSVATPIASQQRSSQPTSVSSRRVPATPNNISRHATPPRPLVAETAYFRRTLTPIARKALKGKVVGCMEKPIDFEGEDPLLLEPELRHRSGSMTPGSITRSKGTPRTAPAGRKSRTKLKAPPATSVAQRLFVRPDEPIAPSAQTAPEDDSDDDEAGNDTFVDVKKRRQPPQRSALGSQPPLNAADLKSSDTVDEEDTTLKRPSPLIDLGRFVRHSRSTQEPEGTPPLADDMQHAETWDEPLFMPASPDSSIGSPPPVRDPSPVETAEKEEPMSPARSVSRSRSPLFPPSSPPPEPSPIGSLQSSPALHAPTPALGVSSPMRPPPSSPAVVPSPAFPASPALRAPTPGKSNPSPLKERESLRKSVQMRSHAGKRLSESLRSPSLDSAETHSEQAVRGSGPSSRLQSPFTAAQNGGSVESRASPNLSLNAEGASDHGEDDFDLEGDTVIVADEERSLELEETYVDTQDADVASPPSPRSKASQEASQAGDNQARLSRVPTPASLPQAPPRTTAGGKDDEAKIVATNGTVADSGIADVIPSPSNSTTEKTQDRGHEREHGEGSSKAAGAVAEQQPPSQRETREDTTEDPLRLEPAQRSASKFTMSRNRQSWLDRVRARSSTPASPLDKKRSGAPASSLDRFLSFTPAAEPSLLTPEPASQQQKERRAVTPDVPRPRFSLSPGMARVWQSQGDPHSPERAAPPPVHPVEAIHGFDVGIEDTVELPSLSNSHVDDQNTPRPDTPFDFSVDASISDDDDPETGGVDMVQVEHRELSIHIQSVEAPEASFDLSADTVHEVEEDAAGELSGRAPDEGEGTALEEAEPGAGDGLQEDHNSQSRSPYISDDSPLADVVNAALDAGMVIEASSAIEETELQPAGQVHADSQRAVTPQAPPSPEDEDTSEAESDDLPLMPSRLRRSLHAGATPMRPKILPTRGTPSTRAELHPRSEKPVTPLQPQRSQSSASTGRSPAAAHRSSSTAGSSPFIRDYSSPFMVKPSVSPVASLVRSSGGRTMRTQPDIVVEPSSPLASPPTPTFSPAQAPVRLSVEQDTASSSARRSAERSPRRIGTANDSHGEPSSAPSVPLASAERSSRVGPARQSVTPTPSRPAKGSATQSQATPNVGRTVSPPIVAPTPRAIRPLPNRGTSVTPRAAPRPEPSQSDSHHLHSHASSRASSRSRSRSPLRGFSPKAIGTATVIAATAVAAAVPAAASPSPATVRAQLSPEPEPSPFVRSAVSSHHSVHSHLNTQSYRSPPRSARSSRLSATPSGHSTQSERSRSPCEPPDRSDHISLANSRLAFALAGLSDDDEEDLPPPPTIRVTPFFNRSRVHAPPADRPSDSPPAILLQDHEAALVAPTRIDSQKDSGSGERRKTTTPSPLRKRDLPTSQRSAEEAKITTPQPRAVSETTHRTPRPSDTTKVATPRPRERAEVVTPVPNEAPEALTSPRNEKARTSTPQSSRSVRNTPAGVLESAKSTPRSRHTVRTVAEEKTAHPPSVGGHEESTEERDIGADDTVVHDFGAHDTIYAGSPWNLTAAEATFDAEMTAFDAHAFKGADWDVTRIERVARGPSEEHRLQDIEEASEEDAASESQNGARTPQHSEPPVEESPARPTTATHASPVPRSPVRQSPRLAARRRAETASQSSQQTVVHSPSPPQSRQGSVRPDGPPTHPSNDVGGEGQAQSELADQGKPRGGGSTEEQGSSVAAAPNHKVTLKVVTRIVKVESDSEDEEITEVADTAPQKEPEDEQLKTKSKVPPQETSAKPSQGSATAAPAPPAPPPAPPPPEALAAVHSKPQADSPAAVVDSAPVPIPTAAKTSLSSRPQGIVTRATPGSATSAPLFASKIPLATAGRPPSQALSTTPSYVPRSDARPARSLETPTGRPQTSFVKDQSRQIEQALGRRPAVPSKLSKEVAPSSSPAESPVAEPAVTRIPSRASNGSPTSPSKGRRRQSDVAETSFASSSSSSRRKRRFEDHFDDDDSERYASRASLHEEITAASDSGSDFDPEFPSMVAVSSVDPRAAARAAAILKMHHNWIENGIMPDGSKVGTPKPQERGRSRSVGALETPQTLRRRSAHDTPHSRFFDSIETSRLIPKEELLHEAELELVGSRSRPGTPFTADSPMRHIPGAWAQTPLGRTPKRKRGTDEQVPHELQPAVPVLETPFPAHPRFDSSTYEGNVDGRSWTKRDWKHLEKTFKFFAAKAQGRDIELEAVVDAFLRQTGKEPVGEWSREVLLLRANALARRNGTAVSTTDRDAKRQKTTAPTTAPPSTLRKVMGWLWPANSKPQDSGGPASASVSAAKPKKLKRDNDFMQVRDDSFEIGEVTMAATPSRPQDRREESPPEAAHHAERSFEVDLERGHQSYDIPYDEEDEDEDEYFLEPTTYTARGERSSVTEASTSMYDQHSTSSARKIYPNLPDLSFPSRPHSLASSTRSARYDEARPVGSRLPVMGTPRPRARVRSDSSIADTSIASRPGSVRDMVRGFEETQELDLSFESARREREKNELLGLRRVRSVVEKVKEQHQL